MKTSIITKGAALIGGAALVVSLAACGGDTDTDPQVSTVTVSESTSATPTTSQNFPDDSVVAPPATSSPSPVTDEEFLDALMIMVAKEEGIHLSEGMGAAYAQDVCDLLDNRYTFYEVIQIAVRDLPEMGLTSNEHAYLVGASIGGACPEYEYQLN